MSDFRVMPVPEVSDIGLERGARRPGHETEVEMVRENEAALPGTGSREPKVTHVVLADDDFEAIGTVSLPSLKGRVWTGKVRLQPLDADQSPAPPDSLSDKQQVQGEGLAK